jgi:multidrug resistance efflux pump
VFFGFACLFSLNTSVEGYGILQPEQYCEVRSEIASLIKQVYVKSGEYVNKGDHLMELSNSNYIIRLAETEKDLERARASLLEIIEANKLDQDLIKQMQYFVQVKTETTGIIAGIHVETGDLVKKGDLLVTIRDYDSQHQLVQAEKDLVIGEAQLKRLVETYKLSYDAFKDVIPDLPSPEKIDDYPEIQIQRAIVEKVSRQIDLLEARLKATKVVSPVSGIILTPNLNNYLGSRTIEGDVLLAISLNHLGPQRENQISVGSIHDINIQKISIDSLQQQVDFLQQRVQKKFIVSPIAGKVVSPDLETKTGMKINEGETLMVIANCDKWVVRAMIKDRNIIRVKPDNDVKVKIEAFPATEFNLFRGKIKSVSNAPVSGNSQFKEDKNANKNNDRLHTYFEVIIQLDDNCVIKNGNKYDFQYGLVAQVNIIAGRKKIIVYLLELILGKVQEYAT